MENILDKKILFIIPTAMVNPNNLIDNIVSLMRFTPEEYDLLIVKNDMRGFANSVNRGLKIVKNSNDYYGCVLINDDVVFGDSDWFKKLIKEKDKYGIISCKGNLNEYKTHTAFWCTYIDKKVIDKIGLLDEIFVLGECEDVDYCRRALDNNFKISDSDCEAFHRVNGTLQHLNKIGKEMIELNKHKLKEKYKGTKWENE